MIIPEVILRKIIESLLQYVKNDYLSATDKTKTLLYHYFNNNIDEKREYFEQAVNLFTREHNNPRRIEVRTAFDAERARIPTVHITIPSENQTNNVLSNDESDSQTLFELQTTKSPAYRKSFQSTFQIVITSDNSSEVLLMYHLIRAGLISVLDTLSLSGLQNAQLSGQELRINSDLVPENIFMRSIGISFFYEVEVPRWWGDEKISDIILCKTNKIVTNGNI